MLDFVNFSHESEYLKDNNDFIEESTFIGILKENIYNSYENEITKFYIDAPHDEVHRKVFVKAPNSLPMHKYLSDGEEDITMLFQKYNCKIDCDGNVYIIEGDDNALYLIGYYTIKKFKVKVIKNER